jgi:predicted flap endonuclease-1-like 5' DNA nuclease
MSDVKKVGPVGGEGGQPFDNYEIPEGAQLREIRLLTDRFVNAIQLIFTDKDGNVGELRPIGGLNGHLEIFTLGTDEYLTAISGKHGWYIDSIQFHTNKRSSDIFGGKGGDTEFILEAPKNHEISGLFGKADWFIDQLGIIVRPQVKSSAKAKSTAKKSSSATKAAKQKKKTTSRKKVKSDDLTIVEGIGPKIASILKDAGIPDLASLAKSEIEHLKSILEKAGKRFNLADPTTWPKQAALAAKEAWEELENLQKKLKGGRKQ